MGKKIIDVYYCGKTYDEIKKGPWIDPVPDNLKPLIQMVADKMKQRNPICCLTVKIDEENNEVIAITCCRYVKEKVRFSFKKKNGKIELIQLPATTLDEEIQQAAALIANPEYNPVVTKKIVDEKKKVALFILREIVDKGSARGYQERYTLYRLRRGHKPKILFTVTL